MSLGAPQSVGWLVLRVRGAGVRLLVATIGLCTHWVVDACRFGCGGTAAGLL